AASGVQWLGDCRDMPRCLSEANIVCLPTYYREGVPKVLLEACAAGRAIVTTDIPGCRDVVRAGENGLLVPPQDVAALAAAIRQLLEDPRLRTRMGMAGRARAEAEFGIEKVVQSHLELYTEFIALEEASLWVVRWWSAVPGVSLGGKPAAHCCAQDIQCVLWRDAISPCLMRRRRVSPSPWL